MSSEPKEIVFGNSLDPAQADAYRQKIAAAKSKGVNSLKGNAPVGHVERPTMPELGGQVPSASGQPSILQPQTQQMLEHAIQAGREQDAVEAEQRAKAEEKTKAEDILDMIDFDGRSEAERILNNKKRRQAIEGRCTPMKVSDLLYKGEVRQVVPIVPGEFEPTYRSITTEENLFIKDYIFRKFAQEKSEAYIQEMHGVSQLACSLVAINDRHLPDHRRSDGTPDEKLFEEKLRHITRMSGYAVADLGVNFGWFDLRVRKLFTEDALKNG